MKTKNTTSLRLVQTLLALHLLALFVGTQMPSTWRDGIESGLHAPFPLSSLAHFLVFSGMGLLLALRPLAWPAGRVMLLALALALLTEGLQFFAMNRHPRWIDVGIDMAGALLALGVVALSEQLRRRLAARSKPGKP